MKIITAFLSVMLLVSCASGKEKTFTGSTPAGAVIRAFLGIPLTDSIDFIRWKLNVNDNSYQLACNYGVGKPNTDGFINDGKKIELSGELDKENIYYRLKNGSKILKLAEFNEDLLHFLAADNSLLVGNGGWSYTLNNIKPSATDQINITAIQGPLKDSMVFEGRTPCEVPGIIERGKTCYKLKWLLILYANPGRNEPGTYKVFGTPWRVEGGRKGNWKILTGKKGAVIYQLYDEKGDPFLQLLKLDEHILMFTDEKGKLLVGNKDFSYTLNRR